MSNFIQNGEQFVPDKLFAGNQIPVLVKGVSLKGAQGKLERGTVIALDDDGNAGIADKIKTTDEIYGVLTDDVTTDEEPTDLTIAEVYITGYFNSEALKFVEGTTLKDFELELRKLGIYTDNVKEV